MKHAIIAITMVVLLVSTPIALFGSTQNNEASAAPVAQSADLVSCTDVRVGQSINIRCTAAGVIVLNESIPLPVVTNVVPGDPVTIRVPLPRETVTERVQVPGPTQTVTEAAPAPGTNNEPTATVTIRPDAQPGERVTVRPEPRPNPTVTQTTPVTSESRQDSEDDATIDPDREDNGSTVVLPRVELSTPEALGLGTLAILLIAGLILLGMYAGYYLGYKDSDKAEAKFLKSLLGR